MSSKQTARLAWTLCGLMTGLAVVLFGAELLSEARSKTLFQLAGKVVYSLAMPILFAIMAALIVSRQPRNTIGWLLMVPVFLFLVAGPIEAYIEHLAPSNPVPTLPLLLFVWFSNWSWLLLIIPLLHIPLLFPNGQPPTRRWRWVSVAAIAWAALFVLIVTFSQRIEASTTSNLAFDNPIGVLGDAMVQPLIALWIAGLLTLVVLCVAALFTRFRRANDTERKQIEWLLYACAVFLVVYIGGIVSETSGTTTFAGTIWEVCFGLSLGAFPAAIGIAILRYRLFDIDVIINRTLVYGSLTVVLALVYFASVVLLEGLFRPLFGSTNDLAIVASTLALAALFQPLRSRIQAFIDRRFYRRRYDAARTLQAFAAHARDEVDVSRLSDEMVRVVHETFQPELVSLWLRPTK